jgi:peptidoglycan/LPS O-acetylase OafA/YrhL
MTASATTSRAPRIDSLTGLRFLAAGAIFLWHIRGYFIPKDAFSPFYLAGAVPLFFVLSGFVLAVGGLRAGSWADFFVARLARIWPAHMAAIALLLAVFWPWSKSYFATSESIGNLVLNVLLIHDWVPFVAVYGGYNGVSWSISAELFFYAVFPFIFMRARTAPWHTLAVTALLVPAWIVLISALFPSVDAGWLSQMNPLTGSFAFVVGVAAGSWYADNKERGSASIASWTALEIAAVGLTLAANAWLFGLRFPELPRALVGFVNTIAAAPAYAVLIVVLALSKGLLARMLSNRVIVYLGEVSFSFYLVHQIIIRWYADHTALFGDVSVTGRLAFITAASLGVSMAIYHLVEMPMRRIIVQGWRSRRNAPSIAPLISPRP